MEPILLLALAAALAGSRPVRIPSLRIDVQPIHPFVLLAIALSGAGGAAIVGVAGLLGAAAGRRPRPRPLRLAFNLTVSVISTTAAAWMAELAGGRPEAAAEEWIWPLAVAAATYFVVGTGLVAAAIAIERSQGYLATWNRSLKWTVLPYALGYTVAVAALAVGEFSLFAGLAVTIAPCWCLLLVYRAEAESRSLAAVPLPSSSTGRPDSTTSSGL